MGLFHQTQRNSATSDLFIRLDQVWTTLSQLSNPENLIQHLQTLLKKVQFLTVLVKFKYESTSLVSLLEKYTLFKFFPYS